MIAGNVPKHLVVGARTGFLTAMGRRDYPWRRVAEVFNMDAAAQDLVDLGAAPMPVESDKAGGLTIQDYIEKTTRSRRSPGTSQYGFPRTRSTTTKPVHLSGRCAQPVTTSISS